MHSKVEKVIQNCLECIMATKKVGRQEELLHPIGKEAPLDTYHMDHLGPIPSTQKRYQYIFAVVDAFTKFVWFYPTRSTNTAEIFDHLMKQSTIFGNPRRIISDQGSAFTFSSFKLYCEDEAIEHSLIVTGVRRGNGQIERINRTLIPLLTKLSMPQPT
ncbi:Pro-Pol polyprotein [Trachymyrmex cornetzi]|uniref:Pro-Pol polyprotein n=1 Tax=Trachymyrmex cornetzi TaxID=471704 RepID=A0A151IT26_9HYME|nr:Pro-Pol polyprotein [Trachymyrmex cornetzi]